MQPSIEDLRKHLVWLLPKKVAEAVGGYEEFSRTQMPMDAKGFAAWHAACKAAIAHVDTLIKLIKWAGLSNQNQSDINTAEDLIEQAKAALAEMEDEE